MAYHVPQPLKIVRKRGETPLPMPEPCALLYSHLIDTHGASDYIHQLFNCYLKSVHSDWLTQFC